MRASRVVPALTSEWLARQSRVQGFEVREEHADRCEAKSRGAELMALSPVHHI
jgi:hypothetical protein